MTQDVAPSGAQSRETPFALGVCAQWAHFVARVRGDDTPHLAALALECGYYDQSHLIHDFREFSGLSPTEYLQRRHAPVKENHLPLAS